MARTRFRQHHEGMLLPPPSSVQAPSTMPVLPTLPQGYGEALTWARRYNRSYSRLSHRMYTTYGPIPRDIPPAFLHTRLAPREDAAERDSLYNAGFASARYVEHDDIDSNDSS